MAAKAFHRTPTIPREHARDAWQPHAAAPIGGRSLGATVSVGAAAGDGTSDISALLMEADAALYRAKALGRNRVARALPGQAGRAAAETTPETPVVVAGIGTSHPDATAWEEAQAAILWRAYPDECRGHETLKPTPA